MESELTGSLVIIPSRKILVGMVVWGRGSLSVAVVLDVTPAGRGKRKQNSDTESSISGSHTQMLSLCFAAGKDLFGDYPILNPASITRRLP